MKYFVSQHSIVRKIWGSADTVMFIFAGSAAEFALNKAVDWLYYTGKLPADPLGRLFSTVTYARQIIFASEEAALKAIDQITAIHSQVEANRGAQIPDWAYRDVLFMLIDYSIRSFELLERQLTDYEKQETYNVFYRVGERMGLTQLPANYDAWLTAREQHLQADLMLSKYTTHLFQQYRKHLGALRYLIVKQVQAMLAPTVVKELLGMSRPWLKPALWIYRRLKAIRAEKPFKNSLLPAAYKSRIQALDIA